MMTNQSNTTAASVNAKDYVVLSTCESQNVGYIWNLQTLELLSTFKNNKNNENSVAVIFNEASNNNSGLHNSQHNQSVPNGIENGVIITSQNHKPAIHIYEYLKEETKYICPLSEHIKAIAVSRKNGTYCVGGSKSGKIYVWKVSTGKLLRIFDAHLKDITCLEFTPNNSFLISASEDTLVHVWNMADILDVNASSQKLRPFKTFSGHSLPVKSIFCGAGGGTAHTRVLTSSLDRTCKLWDLTSGIELFSILFPTCVNQAILNYTEHKMYAAGDDGNVYEAEIYPFSPQFQYKQQSLAQQQKQRRGLMLSSTSDQIMHDDSKVFKGHSSSVTAIAITHDGGILVSASKDGTVRVWDTQSKQNIRTFTRHNSPVSNLKMWTMNSQQLMRAEPQVKPLKKYHSTENDAAAVTSVGANSTSSALPAGSLLLPSGSLFSVNNNDLLTMKLTDQWKQIQNSVEDFECEKLLPGYNENSDALPLSADLTCLDVSDSSMQFLKTTLTHQVYKPWNDYMSANVDHVIEMGALRNMIDALKQETNEQKKINKELYEFAVNEVANQRLPAAEKKKNAMITMNEKSKAQANGTEEEKDEDEQEDGDGDTEMLEAAESSDEEDENEKEEKNVMKAAPKKQQQQQQQQQQQKEKKKQAPTAPVADANKDDKNKKPKPALQQHMNPIRYEDVLSGVAPKKIKEAKKERIKRLKENREKKAAAKEPNSAKRKRDQKSKN